MRWLLERGLFAPELLALGRAPLADGRVDGAQLLDRFERELDGCLLSDMLTEQGDRFARDYYERRWLADYVDAVGGNDPSPYAVAWNESNWQRLAELLDRRYAEFQKPKRRWWPFGGG
ncbi:MAG: hypothetical protein FJ293_07240 [Planctomycetes bacterium]|nr:hypothetical protein [Planctomycetota bacterium]